MSDVDGIDQLCARVEAAAQQSASIAEQTALLKTQMMHALERTNDAIEALYKFKHETHERLTAVENAQKDIGRILRIVSASHRDLQKLMTVWASREIGNGK